jgi:RNA polymerase-binding transcription factor DksA
MNEFTAVRETLLERRDKLLRLINRVTDDVRHTDEPLSYDFSEQAVERQHEEVLDALGEAGRRELSQINRSLARMDAGEYGICAACGEPIPEARLQVMPHCEYCVACAEKQETGR